MRFTSDIHYGWITVGLLLLMMTVSHGIISAGIPVFDSRIIDELGISRGALKFRDFVQILAAGLGGLSIGYAVSRVPAERICQIGLVLLSASLLAYSAVENIWTVYALHLVLGFCYASAHVVIVVLFVSEWFLAKRAVAIAIALSGTSIGSALFPQVGVLLMGQFDWRGALMGLALFPLLVLPLITLYLRRSPQSLGQTSYGTSDTAGPAEAHRGVGSDKTAPFGRKRRRELLLLGVATFGVFYAAAAFILHTFLHLRDQGFGEQAAASGLTIVFLTGLVGKILAGLAADAWGTRQVWLASQVLLLIAALGLTFLHGTWVWPSLFILGLGWAGCYTLTQVMISERFAGPMLSKLVGWFIVFEAVGSGSGSWLTGAMFDLFGSYSVPFMINSGLVAIACGATLLLRPSRRAAA